MNKIIIFSLVCLSFLLIFCGSNNNNDNNTIETPISKTINGYGEPSDDIGNDGDIYVNKNTGDTYTKSNGKWTLTKKGNYNPDVPPTNPIEPSEPSIDNIITFNQTSFDSLPEKLRTHNLTTDDVRNIKDIDDAKGKISSISDAILYFQTIKINNYSSIGIHNNNTNRNVIYYYFDLNKMIDSVSYFDAFSYDASQYYLAYLLSDNFEDSGLLYGFERNGLVEDNICFGTYFKIENKYHVLFNKNFGSRNCLNDYSGISYYYYAVDNLDEIKDLYRGFNSKGLYALVKDIANPKSEVILSNTKFILSGTGTQLYLDNEYLKNLITISESKLYSDIVDTFRLPTELGNQTLTLDEARYLVYKPLDYIK